jgi:hypothetical protein
MPSNAELVAQATAAMREAANVLYAPMFTADRVGDKETANRVSDLITRLRTAADALAGVDAKPVAWSLAAPVLGGVRVLASFLSDSEQDAASRTEEGKPLCGWEVVPLYTHPPLTMNIDAARAAGEG